MAKVLDKDCTTRCRSSTHAQDILSCVSSVTAPQLRSYAVWLCHNFAFVVDKYGRNLLHVASSCGKSDVVKWLIEKCKAEIDVKDLESGWTSLHRSFFFGQLACARELCMHGASLQLTDNESFTPLDIIIKDRLPYIEYRSSDPSEVYVWGSNFNYNLGFENSKSPSVPEMLLKFHKELIDIRQVEICKFHSAFLSSDGKVFTCGYGHGGRLGLATENISIVPSLVKALQSHLCVQIAAGQDHMLFLLQTGLVWSCGLNTYHQLGHGPSVDRILSPKSITMKFLKGKCEGICAARFHSVIYTKKDVYTFGLNAGQLGHPKGDRTQINPRQVSGLNTNECEILHVTTSDGATVCATSRGDVYVLHEYQIRKIASRQLDILKLSVVGGHLDSRCDVAGVREGGALELRVALLTKWGKLYLWRQTDPHLRRCLFTTQKELIISDVHLNHHTMGLLTSENEGYMGTIVPHKGKRKAISTHTHVPFTFSNKPSIGLTVLLDVAECHSIRVKRLANIYRATSITSDSKGQNFAVLQSNPKMGLTEIPFISESKIGSDFSRLLSESHIHDEFHDVILKVGKREFPAHKYILASRSEFFRKELSKENFETKLMVLDGVKPETFDQVLKYIYSNKCDLFTNGYEVNWTAENESSKKGKSGSKASKLNPVSILQKASEKYGVPALAEKLNSVHYLDGKITVIGRHRLPCLKFNRHSLSNLCDVNLMSSEGSIFPCHKCVLVARMDYFHSMLNTSWAENYQLGNLSLPISSRVMKILLDFVYTDEAKKIEDCEDAEFICQVLMTADQFLLARLKEICENALVRLINLQNAAELLEISFVYNAEQLKQSSMQFICINLAAVVESRNLDVLSEDVMEELSCYYQALVPGLKKRNVKKSVHSEVDFESLQKQFPIDDAKLFERDRSYSHESKIKIRQRCSSQSETKDLDLIIKEEINVEKIRETDIVLKMASPQDIGNRSVSSPEKEVEILKPENLIPQKPSFTGPWMMKDVEKKQISLDEIMAIESKLSGLPIKSSSPNMKPFPHISRKQKKMSEAAKDSKHEVFIPSSPPNSCPWAKLPEASPPPVSFWDAIAKKEMPPSPLNKLFSTRPPKPISQPNVKTVSAHKTSPTTEQLQEIVISFHDIQVAEEQKLLRSANPKVKPLHIINIEDQAIEELSILYNIQNNHKEKVTVGRVQSDEIASPVWKGKKSLL